MKIRLWNVQLKHIIQIQIKLSASLRKCLSSIVGIHDCIYIYFLSRPSPTGGNADVWITIIVDGNVAEEYRRRFHVRSVDMK